MRIAFICGSQEAGRDGVGDYTTGFAEELRLQGHDVMVVALRDRHATEVTSAERQFAGGIVPILRLPAALPWPESIRHARERLDRFDPEWVSIQFVCYTFHPKGLVHGLARKLAPLIEGRRLHIMFHEIWLCKEMGWGWKQCMVGAVQRFFIRRFVRAARPAVMHTSNAAYATMLTRNGIPVTEMGLFGAIPILPVSGNDWIEGQVRSAFGDGYRRDAVWLFGLFGALHPQWPPEPLLTRLHRAAQAAGKKPVLLSIGRTGSAGAHLWDRMVSADAGRFVFVRLGEQSTERVSEYLSFLDFGIATTPWSIIGKSSTVVSMLEHGLPVIVNREDAAGFVGVGRPEPLLIRCDTDFETRLQSRPKKGARGSRRPQIAREFEFALEQAGASV